MSERCLVLSGDNWRMADEKTGEIRTGVSVWYVTDYREDSEGQYGFKPIKTSLQDPAMADVIRSKLPCVADLDFRSKPGKEGKASLVLAKISIVKPNVDIFGMGAAKAAA